MKISIQSVGRSFSKDRGVVVNPCNDRDYENNRIRKMGLGIPVSKEIVSRMGPYKELFIEELDKGKVESTNECCLMSS